MKVKCLSPVFSHVSQNSTITKYDMRRILLNKIILAVMTFVCGSLSVQTALAQSPKGQVLEKGGKGIEYANVVVLSEVDSTFLGGAVTANDGSFVLDSISAGNIMKVSAIGYKTCFQAYQRKEDLTVRLETDNYMLDEQVVKSPLPKTILKPGSMVTNVAGTILEKTATMEQLLDRIPLVMAQNNSIAVIGHGSPEIYINGRKMRNRTEMDALTPDNIKSIEVITTPGARYASSVQSVIRITTKKAFGEGWGLYVVNQLSVNEIGKVSGVDNIGWNYRKGRFDMRGFLYGSHNKGQTSSRSQAFTYAQNQWNRTNNISSENTNATLGASLSANYQFNDKHSLGVRLQGDRIPKDKTTSDTHSVTMLNDALAEQMTSHVASRNYENSVDADGYYEGQIGKVRMDVNVSYAFRGNKGDMLTLQQYSMVDGENKDEDVSTSTNSHANIFASKLVMGAPLAGGSLHFGGEYASSLYKSIYNVLPAGYVSDGDNRRREKMAAAFVEYGFTLGKLNVQAGLRYEYFDFEYHDHGQYMPGLSRSYGSWLPRLSMSMSLGNVQMQLNYVNNNNYPSYGTLNTDTIYSNRYTYSTGNPELVTAVNNFLNYGVSWKWLYGEVTYGHHTDPMFQMARAYKGNPQMILRQPENLGGYDHIMMLLSLRPQFGIWHPTLEMSFYKQWLKMEVHDRNSLNSPRVFVRLTNTFDTQWVNATLSVTCSGNGYDGNSTQRRAYFYSYLSLYKDFFDSKLKIQLVGYNLFNSGNYHNKTYYGPQYTELLDQYNHKSISLAIRYSFNFGKSKYKGTGAGDIQKQRM